MAVSVAAKSNHDQLFGDRVSTLAQSDPELIEYFDNFAFGEVHADAARLDETLDLHTRLMVQLAAILAAGGRAEFRVVAAAAVANGGVSPVELKGNRLPVVRRLRRHGPRVRLPARCQ
jgi:4-carboxymuconolactone decarboxylase